MMKTHYIDDIPIRTAASFMRLAAVRGIKCECKWDREANAFVVNGHNAGPSVHGLCEWLDKQPGVLP